MTIKKGIIYAVLAVIGAAAVCFGLFFGGSRAVKAASVGEDDTVNGDINIEAEYEDNYRLTFDAFCGGYSSTLTIEGKSHDYIRYKIQALSEYKNFVFSEGGSLIFGTVGDGSAYVSGLAHYADRYDSEPDNIIEFNSSSPPYYSTFGDLAELYPTLSQERFKLVVKGALLGITFGNNIDTPTPGGGPYTNSRVGDTIGSMLNNKNFQQFYASKYEGYHILGVSTTADGDLIDETVRIYQSLHSKLFIIYGLNVYDVTLRYLNASGVQVETVLNAEHGSKLIDVLNEFELPEVEGKKFKGWNVSEDVLLLSSVSYTLNIDDYGIVIPTDENGGTVAPDPEEPKPEQGFFEQIYNGINNFGTPWNTLTWIALILIGVGIVFGILRLIFRRR